MQPLVWGREEVNGLGKAEGISWIGITCLKSQPQFPGPKSWMFWAWWEVWGPQGETISGPSSSASCAWRCHFTLAPSLLLPGMEGLREWVEASLFLKGEWHVCLWKSTCSYGGMGDNCFTSLKEGTLYLLLLNIIALLPCHRSLTPFEARIFLTHIVRKLRLSPAVWRTCIRS